MPIAVGDAASTQVWDPRDHVGVTLLAGGVPCPPFSVAGKQLGSSDERDLFAWTIEQVSIIRPRAIMLENVRGLSSMRFAAYRQRVLDRLDAEGYVGEWKLLYAGRFWCAAVAAQVCPGGDERRRPQTLPLAGSLHIRTCDRRRRTTLPDGLRGWPFADEWRTLADGVGPTLVGGSKKHGGADLGPTRAKQAWAQLFVDGRGVANQPPTRDAPSATEVMPRLTIEMTARIQGWHPDDNWIFAGRKTSQYRQIGNAFPPPVAQAVGTSIASALSHQAARRGDLATSIGLQDPIYKALASSARPLSLDELLVAQQEDSLAAVERKLAAIKHDFELEVLHGQDGTLSLQARRIQGIHRPTRPLAPFIRC